VEVSANVAKFAKVFDEVKTFTFQCNMVIDRNDNCKNVGWFASKSDVSSEREFVELLPKKENIRNASKEQ
jgi:hypothetical protein